MAKHGRRVIAVAISALLTVCAGPLLRAAPGEIEASSEHTFRVHDGTVRFDFDEPSLAALDWTVVTSGPDGQSVGTTRAVFGLSTSPTFTIVATGRGGAQVIVGELRTLGVLMLHGTHGRTVIGDFSVAPDPGGRWTVRDTIGHREAPRTVFDLRSVNVDFSASDPDLRMTGDVFIAASWADRLGLTVAGGAWIGTITIEAQLAPLPFEKALREPEGVESADQCSTAASVGPDVLIGDLQSVLRYGRVGDITAYAVGTNACNIGDQRVSWDADTNAHPVIAQNMYRLKNGRFEQIGMSWVKHGFYAVSQGLCEPCYDPVAGGQELGVGCSDPYSASLNGDPNNMSLLSDVNGFTGHFPFPWEAPDPEMIIGKRLQVKDAAIDPDDNPGAEYFIQGHYIAADDAAAGNDANNASYRRILVTEPVMHQFDVTLADATRRGLPAIHAWKEFDPEVELTDVLVPGEGLFILGAKATDLGGGYWHYEYALQNLCSDRSAGSFSVPIPGGTTVENTGFHDVDYHSGEIYGLTSWAPNVAGDAVTWSTDEYGTDPNANALRFSTLYNFRFDADMPPGTGDVTIGLFKPGTPVSVTATTTIPVPNGACCIDGTCTSTTIEAECDELCGIWHGGESCPSFGCPLVTVSGTISVRDRSGSILDPTAHLPEDSVVVTVWEGWCGATQYWPPPEIESPIAFFRVPENESDSLPFTIPNLRGGADYTLALSAYVDGAGVPLDHRIVSFEADATTPLDIALTHEDLRKWTGEQEEIIYSFGEWTDADPEWGAADRFAEKEAVQRALDEWSATGLATFTESNGLTGPTVTFHKRFPLADLPGYGTQRDRWGLVPGTVDFASDAPWVIPDAVENVPVLEWFADDETDAAVWIEIDGYEPFEYSALQEIGHVLGLRYPRRWWQNEKCEPVPGSDCQGTTYCDNFECQQWSVMANSQSGRSLWLGLSDVATLARLNSSALVFTAYSRNVVTLEAGTDSSAGRTVADVAAPTGSSLVDLILTDATGSRVFKMVSEIPGAEYLEEDINGDGDIDDRIVIPEALDGEYSVQLIVEPGADPTDTVTLTMEDHGVITVLLDNVQVQDLPVDSLGAGVDRTPPQLTVTAVPDLLNTCDGSLIALHADISVLDDMDATPDVVLIDIDGFPQPLPGDVVGADFGQDDRDFQVRSVCTEGCGQIYRITYEASDDAGNITYVSAIVGHALNDLTYDCNLNSFPDSCDIALGISEDVNSNRAPDECSAIIPTVSEWGLVVSVLLLLSAGTAVIIRRRSSPVS